MSFDRPAGQHQVRRIWNITKHNLKILLGNLLNPFHFLFSKCSSGVWKMIWSMLFMLLGLKAPSYGNTHRLCRLRKTKDGIAYRFVARFTLPVLDIADSLATGERDTRFRNWNGHQSRSLAQQRIGYSCWFLMERGSWNWPSNPIITPINPIVFICFPSYPHSIPLHLLHPYDFHFRFPWL